MTTIREPMSWSRPLSISVRKGTNLGSSLTALREEMTQLFDNFFTGRPLPITDWSEETVTTPVINLIENGDSFRVEAELAGMDLKDVDVESASGFLTLKGERREEKKREEENYLCREISYGSFARTVALPKTADGGKAQASFKNGILTVIVPKKPEAVQSPEKIEIGAFACPLAPS